MARNREEMTNTVLVELAGDTCRRLGYVLAPEQAVAVHRRAYAYAVECGLEHDLGVVSVMTSLAAVDGRLEEAESRWRRNGGTTSGRSWGRLVKASEAYWDTLRRTTGFLLDRLEREGVDESRILGGREHRPGRRATGTTAAA